MLRTLYPSSSLYSSVNSSDIPLSTHTRWTLLSAGSLLAVVSLILTVKLTWALADTDVDKYLMAALGVGIEICKWIFVPLGLMWLFQSKGVKSLPLLLAGLSVTVISILASLGFLLMQTDESAKRSVTTSASYQTLNSQLLAKQQQIDALQKRLSIDSGSRFSFVRGRADDSLSQMAELEAAQTALLAKLSKLEEKAQSKTGALFEALATFLPYQPEEIKIYGYIVLSLLLELCGMTALALSSSATSNIRTRKQKDARPDRNMKTIDTTGLPRSHQDKKPGKSRPEISVKEPHKKKDKRPEVLHKEAASIPSKSDNRYQHACRLIQKKQIAPTFRALKFAFQMGDETARNYLEQMVNEGVLFKQGRSYVPHPSQVAA